MVALVAAAVGLVLLLDPVVMGRAFRTWALARSSGLVAYMLLWASVCLGLAQSMGLLRRRLGAAVADLHCFVSVAALYVTVFHAAILLWDRHTPFLLHEVLVPFESRHRPFLVGIGVTALHVLLATVVTTYLRTWVDAHWSRRLHRATVVAFLLALAHGVFLGTDTSHPLVRLLYVETGLAAAVLAVARASLGSRQPAAPSPLRLPPTGSAPRAAAGRAEGAADPEKEKR